MFYHLLYGFGGDDTALRVFQYITLRTALATMTSLLITFLLAPWFIRKMQTKQYGQQIREDGPQGHFSKAGTPTMGGGLILVAVVLATLLWSRLDGWHPWMALAFFVGFGLIGFMDDWMKVSRKNSAGVSGKIRLLLEFALSGGILAVMFLHGGLSQDLTVPFAWDPILSLPLWIYIPFGALVVVGTANAINLTDGLDGLAIGPVMTTTLVYAGLAYISGNSVFAQYLNVPYVPGAGELTVFCGALFGAGLAFLWYNTFPASVFMGDLGSLSLGGALGAVAVFSKNELLMLIVGGVFVVEALSVILQVGSFKLTGKRIFRMAPFHHSLELHGWAEPKIVVRLWIVSILLALVALSTLKLKFNIY